MPIGWISAGNWTSTTTSRSAAGRPNCRCMPGLQDLLSIFSVRAHVLHYMNRHLTGTSNPLSKGPLQLPYQRPVEACRTFTSPLVEKVIKDLNDRIVDKDIARLFENAFPNTLDTTVRWHVDGTQPKVQRNEAHSDIYYSMNEGKWDGPQSFIVTGDINAEWLRDSTNQLAQYQPLAKKDKALETLILGAINTQAAFVVESPYCNAFQPPPPSGLAPSDNGQQDFVMPSYENSRVFECKYELDSLAAFLSLSNQFWKSTHNAAFLTPAWYEAVETLLKVLENQARPTFNEQGGFEKNVYSFMRNTNIGTETLNLQGVGNPLAVGTGLIRSAFRPSDDATILGFLVPANAMMAVELKRAAALLKSAATDQRGKGLIDRLVSQASKIEKGIWEYAVFEHPKWGKVFAYEVDGYGSRILMDDANLPSLLALPLLGFVDASDPVYQNTRKMILSQQGNPYYLSGPEFSGIGGPHVGLQHAWPMSVLVQAMTSNSDTEIERCLNLVRNVSSLGLVNEGVNVGYSRDITRSWFAWANSVFAQTVLDIAKRKPHLLFGQGGKAYDIE
jgi:meiotically up-regulated gene 157 (Mug157) protein